MVNIQSKVVVALALGAGSGVAFAQDAPVVPQTPVSPPQTTVRSDAPVVPQTAIKVSDFKEPTKATTQLPINPVYNISTLDQRLKQYIPDLKRPTVGILAGGQPMPQAWEHVANAGIKTVINLRPQGELGLRDEGAEVRAAGLDYVSIPVNGAAGLTAENADRLWNALKASRGGALVHCSTGNRASALLTLAAHWEAGMSKQEALEFGRRAGLSGLAPTVEALLDGKPLPVTTPPVPPPNMKKPAAK